jgi:hypothetical protein
MYPDDDDSQTKGQVVRAKQVSKRGRINQAPMRTEPEPPTEQVATTIENLQNQLTRAQELNHQELLNLEEALRPYLPYSFFEDKIEKAEGGEPAVGFHSDVWSPLVRAYDNHVDEAERLGKRLAYIIKHIVR